MLESGKLYYTQQSLWLTNNAHTPVPHWPDVIKDILPGEVFLVVKQIASDRKGWNTFCVIYQHLIGYICIWRAFDGGLLPIQITEEESKNE